QLADRRSFTLIQMLVPHFSAFLVPGNAKPQCFADFLPIRLHALKAKEFWTVHSEAFRIACRSVRNSHGDFGLTPCVVADGDDQCICFAALERNEAVERENGTICTLWILCQPLFAACRALVNSLRLEPKHLTLTISGFVPDQWNQGRAIAHAPHR